MRRRRSVAPVDRHNANERSGHRGHRARASRRWLTAAAVIAAAVGGVLVIRYAVQIRNVQRLPHLPDLSWHPRSVLDHLGGRLADAENNPASAAAVGALCIALHADMFYDEAQQCYVLVQKLDGNDWRWPYYDALIRSERGGGKAFVAALRTVLEKMPQFGPAWWRLGEAEFKEGRYERAEQAWSRAETSSEPERNGEVGKRTADVPLSAYASLGLARVALARGDPNTARRRLERLTEAAPRFGSAFRLLAESDTLLGRTEDAERARRRANQLPAYAPYADPMIDVLAAESRNSTFLLRQASDADLATNAVWSEHLIRRAMEFDPENPDALSKLGRVLRTLGRNEEALEFFSLYNRQVPGDFQGLAQIGSCLSDLGRPEEAERYLRRALEGVDDALTHYNLGVVLVATNRVAEATVEYRRALDRDPLDLGARNNLAAALVKQGHVAEARRELSRVLAIDPENALARANLDIVRSLKP